jgi:hypothetical protein
MRCIKTPVETDAQDHETCRSWLAGEGDPTVTLMLNVRPSSLASQLLQGNMLAKKTPAHKKSGNRLHGCHFLIRLDYSP